MISGEIHILPTVNTPEYIFNSDGMFIVRGRSLFKNQLETFTELNIWLDEYLINPQEITYVIISLEYLSSFGTTVLVAILRKINKVVLKSKKLVIHWYYEEDDEDLLERGEYISITFDLPITFILTDHTTDF